MHQHHGKVWWMYMWETKHYYWCELLLPYTWTESSFKFWMPPCVTTELRHASNLFLFMLPLPQKSNASSHNNFYILRCNKVCFRRHQSVCIPITTRTATMWTYIWTHSCVGLHNAYSVSRARPGAVYYFYQLLRPVYTNGGANVDPGTVRFRAFAASYSQPCSQVVYNALWMLHSHAAEVIVLSTEMVCETAESLDKPNEKWADLE